jgi:hypothetical protein
LAVAHYRRTERLQDEEALLRFFRDCEEDFRAIQACSTWQEIKAPNAVWRQPPGITNLLALATNFNGRTERSAILNSLYWGYQFGFEPRAKGAQLWRVADSETMRRLLVVALALERYRLRQGAYPESLDALPPDLLPSRPLDFMDGKPLRYRRDEQGRFILYSAGQDCQDDGGCSRLPGMLWPNSGRDHTDFVWPRPASPAEIATELSERQRLPEAQTHRATFVPAR